VFVSAVLQDQLEAMRSDRLRVLIAGAGVAGLTLAQLLRAEGLHPVLIERASNHDDAGYMLALMPLVDAAFDRLGMQQTYREHSVRFHRYRMHGHRGQLLRESEIDTLLGKYGDYRGIARGDLMQVLATGSAPVSYESTIQAIRQEPESVYVTLQNNKTSLIGEFDAVILADGLHSSSRALLLRPDQITTYDTRWGGWVAWVDSDEAHADQGDEIWGADFFVGIYPVKDRAGIIVAGNNADTRRDPAAFVAKIRKQLRASDPWMERALDKIEVSVGLYYWRLVDCRSAAWAVDRVALLGDAAAGFLPTAGIGAAMAMESATVLAHQLAAANRSQVPGALREYQGLQRPRVESAQDNSRLLAKMMFRRGRALAVARDMAGRLMTLKAALRPIIRLLESRPLARRVEA
jgi:2-polyprenyl-6-methoxyphenol hydroxylase-like FAD-dependent oxidoreductase